jgi:hypothetical protein
VAEGTIVALMRDPTLMNDMPGMEVRLKCFKKIKDEVDEEESEGRYKLVRHHVEKFLKQSQFGKWIESSIGLISFLSSVAFVALSYRDLSQYDECCSQGEEFRAKCFKPACDEFFNIRWPKSFMYFDKVICSIYLVEYILNLFISQNRR